MANEYIKPSFGKQQFRAVLKNFVQYMERKEIGYEVSMHWNISFVWTNKAFHPMVLKFIKKEDAVVISLFDPINTVDKVRFVVNNRDAVANLEYKDFFPTLMQRAIYNFNCEDNRF